ncbi:hypothetical protein [Gryllotalpicola daejeonensis]|uniref:hypothetical protein n=1 Tax=Gryllotalpicola daejeonensis TaxID=993087 RepID=UPI0031E40FD2
MSAGKHADGTPASRAHERRVPEKRENAEADISLGEATQSAELEALAHALSDVANSYGLDSELFDIEMTPSESGYQAVVSNGRSEFEVALDRDPSAAAAQLSEAIVKQDHDDLAELLAYAVGDFEESPTEFSLRRAEHIEGCRPSFLVLRNGEPTRWECSGDNADDDTFADLYYWLENEHDARIEAEKVENQVSEIAGYFGVGPNFGADEFGDNSLSDQVRETGAVRGYTELVEREGQWFVRLGIYGSTRPGDVEPTTEYTEIELPEDFDANDFDAHSALTLVDLPTGLEVMPSETGPKLLKWDDDRHENYWSEPAGVRITANV